MAKDIKTREKSHHTIKKLDKSIAYTSRIKKNMLDNYRKTRKNDKDNNEQRNERNYATDKVIRSGEKIAKQTGYVISGVSKDTYKKARLKMAERRLNKKEKNEANDKVQFNSDDSKEENNVYSNRIRLNSKNKLEKGKDIADDKKTKIQDFQKKKFIKEKRDFKNIKTHDYMNNDIKLNNNAIKIKTRENVKMTNNVLPSGKVSTPINRINNKSNAKNVSEKGKKAKEITKKVEKAIVNTGKSIVRGAKGLTALLIAGGSGIIMFILVIVMIGGILKSTLGFFFTDETAKVTGNMTIGDSLNKLEDELDMQIKEIKSNVDYDQVVVNKGDIWWKDIITMYAVIASNRENMDITTMNDENYEKLKEIFNEVVDVSYETSTYYVIYVHTVNGEQVRERQARTRLEINVNCMTFDEMVGHFAFSVSERDQALLLLSQEYDSMWEKIFADFD